jgi:hypothetical protein
VGQLPSDSVEFAEGSAAWADVMVAGAHRELGVRKVPTELVQENKSALVVRRITPEGNVSAECDDEVRIGRDSLKNSFGHGRGNMLVMSTTECSSINMYV